MSERMLDIQIAVAMPTPDILLGVNRRSKTVSIEVDRGGEYFPPYEGPYRVVPALYWQQRLATYGKHMEDDVLVENIHITETLNPQGGRTIVIG